MPTRSQMHKNPQRTERKKYVILKPNKGNGVVLLKTVEYISSMTELFADRTKFHNFDKNNTLTQLTTLQTYLRTLHNRGKINDDVYNNIQPQSIRPACSHGLSKTHKSIENLSPFRPVINTTGTAYQPIARYLSCLLNPLTHNELNLRDSFDAVNRIKNIPNNLFAEGYRFIFFDVKSLFTNIPLNKTINIILDKIYNENKILTTLKKHTHKKLLHDACTKTPFFANG